MKIYYFTSAQEISEFKKTLHMWRISPNLSNQNFHNKLIRALAISHHVDVISIRPINKNFEKKVLEAQIAEEGNVTWRYIKISQNRVAKRLFLYNRISSISSKAEKDDVVIADTLNSSILKAANKFAKNHKLPIFGVCTDNPLNISYTNKKYQNDLLSLGQSLDGYICLTEKLNELYNINHKPFVLIDGVTEQNDIETSESKINEPYIFFGGSLMFKYGVNNLIKAFEGLNRDDLKLVICGHHEEVGFKDYLLSHPNVIYLGALDYQEVNALEKGALVAVNPRPNMPEIDEYSFPSKTLEYLANGVITVTVKNKILEENYKDAIIWANSGEVEDLKEALNKALSLSKKEIEDIKKFSTQIINERTSLSSVNKIINKLF